MSPGRRRKFMLALALGFKTVAELDATMDAAEYAEWMALLEVEPWGVYRADLHTALLAWTQASMWAKDAKFSNYLLKFGEDPPPEADLDEEYERERFKAMQARLIAMGGIVPNG